MPTFRSAVPRHPDVVIHMDNVALPACEGESLISALLNAGLLTGASEFDGMGRAGFCLMGACQDCTVWTAQGQRLRACMTLVEPGMRLSRRPVSGQDKRAS